MSGPGYIGSLDRRIYYRVSYHALQPGRQMDGHNKNSIESAKTYFTQKREGRRPALLNNTANDIFVVSIVSVPKFRSIRTKSVEDTAFSKIVSNWRYELVWSQLFLCQNFVIFGARV